MLGTPPGWAACARLPAHERMAAETAFTLVELIVASALALIVAGAAASFMVSSLRSANAASSRAVATRGAELMLAKLARELRQAQRFEKVNTATNKNENKTPVTVTYGSPVNGTTGGTSSSVSFYLPNPGSTAEGTIVTWSCSAVTMTCTRTAKGSTVTMLTGVESARFTPYAFTGGELESGVGAAASPKYPTSVGLSLKVRDVSQLDLERTHAVTGVSKPIIVQDGVSLRNYAS
jgi:type II secretory pathway pseudopilin PulG